jgi:hypothetical protein
LGARCVRSRAGEKWERNPADLLPNHYQQFDEKFSVPHRALQNLPQIALKNPRLTPGNMAIVLIDRNTVHLGQALLPLAQSQSGIEDLGTRADGTALTS